MTNQETCANCGHKRQSHNEIYDERDILMDVDECLSCPCQKFVPQNQSQANKGSNSDLVKSTAKSDTRKGIFDTMDLEKLRYDQKGYSISRIVIKERQRLKAEVEKVINKMLEEGLNGQRYNFMINGEELKKRLGLGIK